MGGKKQVWHVGIMPVAGALFRHLLQIPQDWIILDIQYSVAEDLFDLVVEDRGKKKYLEPVIEGHLRPTIIPRYGVNFNRDGGSASVEIIDILSRQRSETFSTELNIPVGIKQSSKQRADTLLKVTDELNKKYFSEKEEQDD